MQSCCGCRVIVGGTRRAVRISRWEVMRAAPGPAGCAGAMAAGVASLCGDDFDCRTPRSLPGSFPTTIFSRSWSCLIVPGRSPPGSVLLFGRRPFFRPGRRRVRCAARSKGQGRRAAPPKGSSLTAASAVRRSRVDEVERWPTWLQVVAIIKRLIPKL